MIEKECPSCKRQIPADALFCLYCGTQFTITYQGYCANCHTVRSLNASNRCANCDGEVVDPQVISRLVGSNPPSLEQQLRHPLSQRGKKGSASGLGWVRGCLLLILGGLSILLAVYYLSGDFREMIRSLGDVNVVSPVSTKAADNSDIQTQPPADAEPTRTYQPTKAPVIDLPIIPPNAVCVGAFDYGLSCFDNGVWINIAPDQLPYTGHLSDIAACKDEIYLLVSDVLYGFSGGTWRKYGQYGGSISGMIGCGMKGDIWIFDDEKGYHFENDIWTEYVYETVLHGVGYLSVNEVKMTENNQVWVAANENVVHYDGTTWTVFENKKDLNTDYRLTGLDVDSKGTVWVTFLDGLASYNGTTWTKIAPPGSSEVNTVFIDPMDQVWVGTDGGVSMIQSGGWQRYPIGKLAGGVTTLAMDGQQRIWVGTDWGLGILEKGNYTFYHMSNTNLLMNDIENLIVLGDGPALPEKVEKKTGLLVGRLKIGTTPLGNARVEVCVQSINRFFSGATPCADQPFMTATTSDGEGNFTFENLPTGYYIVTFQMPDGKWKVRSNTIGVGSVYIPVRTGDTTNLGELDVRED